MKALSMIDIKAYFLCDEETQHALDNFFSVARKICQERPGNIACFYTFPQEIQSTFFYFIVIIPVLHIFYLDQ